MFRGELVEALRAPGFSAFCSVNKSLEESAIDAYDRLLQPVERLVEISPWLVSAKHRPGQASNAQDRTDSAVAVATGEDVDAAVGEVLIALDAAETVVGKRVAIRANNMLAYDRRDTSNHVSPEVLAALVKALRAAGATDVAVLDAPNIYDRYFGGRSIQEVAEYLGFDTSNFRLVGATADLIDVDFERGIATTSASREWVDADVRIVLAKLAGDPSEILRRADQWFGESELVTFRQSELGPLREVRVPQGTRWFRFINATALPVYMNFSGDGRLFVPRFDEEAFPPLDNPGVFVRSVRSLAQRAFGLHPKAPSSI